MFRIRNSTTLAAILASTMTLGGAANAQEQDAVSALVACVMGNGDAPCPSEITPGELDEAISVIAETTGNPPGQVRQSVRQVVEAAGIAVARANDEAAAPAEEAEAASTDMEADEVHAAEGVTENATEPAQQAAEPAQEAAGEPTDTAGQAEETTQPTEDAQAAEAAPEPSEEAEDTAGAAPEPAEADPAAPAEARTGIEGDAEAEAQAEAQAEADAAEMREEEAETTAEVEMPGPDATDEDIVEALSGMEDGEQRDSLLARLQEMQAEDARAAEEMTEAEAPDAEEQARRQDMAREATEAAMQSEALEVLEADAEAAADAAAETRTEVVTEETSRSFDEDAAQITVQTAEDDDDDADETLRNILGGAAAGFVIGQLLGTGDEVVAQTDDRVIVNRDGEYVVLKDENTLLRRPGTTVETQNYPDGSSRTIVTRDSGVDVVTVRAPDGRILYRARIEPDGRRIVLIDERQPAEPVRAVELPPLGERGVVEYETGTSPDALARALREAETAQRLDRSFSLRQVLYNEQVRELMPRIDLDAITFPTGSAAIQPSQAEELAALGRAMEEMIEQNPDELFLIEGHTDTVGGEVMNLALSDRRAESVALALAEYFDIPPENMVTQGYGERFLKYPIAGNVRENRRAAVRRITPLIRPAQR